MNHIIVLLLLLIIDLSILFVYSDTSYGIEEFGKDTQGIIVRRKFETKTYLVRSDGHDLELIRIVNPAIEGPKRRPTLFVHGWAASSGIFVANSADVRPRDYSNIDIRHTSLDNLIRLLANEPAKDCLAFLMSCFGRDVWLLNRRPVSDSIRLNLTNPFLYPSDWTFQSLSQLAEYLTMLTQDLISSFGDNIKADFWDYSLDEQAEHDLPRVIDFIIEKTKATRVSLVTHSAGSAIALMMLTSRPEYADKIAKSAILAPALNLGNNPRANQQIQFLTNLEPILRSISCPLDLRLFQSTSHSVIATMCAIGLATSMTCSQDGLDGKSNNQNVNLIYSEGGTFTSHETAQLMQSVKKNRMHHFDYGESRNLLVYGTRKAPIYKTQSITSRRLVIWQGNSDALVDITDYESLLNNLSVPVEKHLINETGINFNHDSFFYHKNVSTLFIIPALKSLEEDYDWGESDPNEI